MLLCGDFNLLLLVTGCVFDVADFFAKHFCVHFVSFCVFFNIKGNLAQRVLDFISSLFGYLKSGLALLEVDKNVILNIKFQLQAVE